jgi:hypothetical protein
VKEKEVYEVANESRDLSVRINAQIIVQNIEKKFKELK